MQRAYFNGIFSGILGLWIILLVFLGFSSTLTAFFLVATGLAVAILGFWSASLIKPAPKIPPESEISPPPAARLDSAKRAGQAPENDNGPENPSQNNAPQDF